MSTTSMQALRNAAVNNRAERDRLDAKLGKIKEALRAEIVEEWHNGDIIQVILERTGAVVAVGSYLKHGPLYGARPGYIYVYSDSVGDEGYEVDYDVLSCTFVNLSLRERAESGKVEA